MADGPVHPEHVFLIEGARSYPKALSALREFRSLVVDRCRTALESELENVSQAMGVIIRPVNIVDYRRPEKPDTSDGQSASLGVRVDREVEGWWFYHTVYWYKGEVGIGCSLWLRDKSTAQDAVNELKRTNAGLFEITLEEGHEVCLSRGLLPDDMQVLEDLLVELLRQWAKLWKEAGTLTRFSAKSAEA